MSRTANAKEGDLIAFGHTHKPWHHEVAGIPFLNTGSVGKPKEGDWRVGYVLVEAEEEVQAVEFVRVEYDVERAAEGILHSTLPDDFADQLRAGGNPQPVEATQRIERKGWSGDGGDEGTLRLPAELGEKTYG
jgi:diadenosine tetraphosphatase ApaH/serine/threonine PP2A family protein phosphatase